MTLEDCERFFIEAGISTDLAKTHGTKFADEKLMRKSRWMLDQLMLKELGVTLIEEALCILKQAKEANLQTIYTHALAAKPPQLNLEMTPTTVQEVPD